MKLSIKKNLKLVGYGFYFIIQIATAFSLVALALFYFICNHAAMVNLLGILLIIIPYIGIFTILTLYYGVKGFVSLIKKRELKGLDLFSWERKLKNSSVMAIMHLIVSILMIIIFLFMTVIDYFQPVSLFALVIVPLVLVTAGYFLIFFINVLSFISQKIKVKLDLKRNDEKKGSVFASHLPGSITLLFVLLLFTPLIIPIYFLNDPQFSEGLNLKKDLFVGGEGKYDTYRIPSLFIIPKGAELNNSETLEDDLVLAICEGRRYSALDDGEVDIVMKRSKDGGKSWGDLKTIIDTGDPNDFIRNADPMIVFENNTGMLFMFYRLVKYENKITWKWGEVSTFLVNSSNGGKDWSPPKKFDLRSPSPGHGIQLKYGPKAGRLLTTSYGGVAYSDDNGKTWKNGDKTTSGGECEVLESVDGRVYIALRKDAPLGTLNKDHRQYAWSEDAGETWSKVKKEEDLPTPICMASINRLTDNITYEKNRVIFSNPADYVDRARMTVRISYDECGSWTEGKMIYEGPSGYSEVGVHNDKTISCLFECGQFEYSEKITYVQFDLDWLTDGEDKLNPR